jgi:hypothetical protein
MAGVAGYSVLDGHLATLARLLRLVIRARPVR